MRPTTPISTLAMRKLLPTTGSSCPASDTQVLTSDISIEHVFAMFPPEVDTALIPTGRLVCVKGTPFDLTKPTRLGEVLFPDPSLCSNALQ